MAPDCERRLIVVARSEFVEGGTSDDPGASGSGSLVILEARDLVKQFGGKLGLTGRGPRVQAVAGVTLRIGSGEIVGLIGESGCGKSTLARLLAALDHPTSGSVSYLGRNISRLDSDRELSGKFRQDIQIVFQDPISSLNPRLSIYESVAEGLRIRGLGGFSSNRDLVLSVMGRVRLPPDVGQRFPTELSGGQLQRVALARSVIMQPKVLIADEPVSSLDLLVQGEVLNLLEEFRETSGLAIVFVTHNMAVAAKLCDRIVVMYLGKFVEIASARELYSKALHPYTVALLSAIPDLSAGRGRKHIILQGDPPDASMPPSGCRFRTRCPVAQPICAEVEPPLEQLLDGHHVACHFPGSLT